MRHCPAIRPFVAAPLKVFVLAGQSNMEGQAVVDLDGKDYNDGKGTLNFLLRDPQKIPLVKHLSKPDGTGWLDGSRSPLRAFPSGPVIASKLW